MHPELAEGPIPLLKWVYIAALPIAAALAFFVLNRETATQPETLDQTLMSEAAEGFYESKVEEAPLLEIDSQTIAELQEKADGEVVACGQIIGMDLFIPKWGVRGVVDEVAPVAVLVGPAS